MSAGTAARLASALIGVAVALGALQLLAARRHLRPGGFWDWGLLRQRRRWTARGRLAHTLDRMFRPAPFAGLLAVQIASGLALVVAGPSWPAAGVALGTHLLVRLRLQFGIDGSDQMTGVVLAGLLAYSLAGPGWPRTAALGFVGAQAVLCYLTAGVTKLFSPHWRGGTALSAVVGTREFGLPRLRPLLAARPGLDRAAGWTAIGLEASAPAAVLLGPGPCVAFVALAAAFHLAVAVVMGLNDFLWAFGAALPAMVFLSTKLV